MVWQKYTKNADTSSDYKEPVIRLAENSAYCTIFYVTALQIENLGNFKLKILGICTLPIVHFTL